MNAIGDVIERNLRVTTEPGVITEVLQKCAVEGLFIAGPKLKGQLFYRWEYGKERWWTRGG
ncbi:MAG: hypothetical protein U0T56_11400 [Ferruginibacter sp.]